MDAIKRHPLVSVITVNYNQSGITCEFLDSLKDITYPNIEVFVVDNNSPNDNPDIIKEKFPNITLIKSNKNTGFAGGNNIAIPYCKGKYILFINNDTEVDSGFLEPMVNLLESNPKIGMVSPRIQYFHSPGIIQYAGFTKFNLITTRIFSHGFGEKDTGQFSDESESGSIFGTAMLVPTKVIKEVGMMSEIFFLYYEEHDWAAFIKENGYSIYYQGNSLVYHKESLSTGRNSPFQTYYLSRGRILFTRRNTKGFKKFLALLYIYIITTPRISIGYLSKLQFAHVWAYWRAVWWNIFNSSKSKHKIPKMH